MFWAGFQENGKADISSAGNITPVHRKPIAFTGFKSRAINSGLISGHKVFNNTLMADSWATGD